MTVLSLALSRRGNGTTAEFALSPGELRKWLETLPVANPQEALRCIAEQLEAMNHSELGWRLQSDLAELLRQRIETLLPAVEADLSEATLPLSARRRAFARTADEALAGLTHAYKSVLVALTRRAITFRLEQFLLPPLIQSLKALARRLAISHRIYAPHPRGVWREMHFLFRFGMRHGIADAHLPGTALTASAVYRQALLLAFAQPPKLMQWDVERLAAYLARFGERAVLGGYEPDAAMPGTFVIRSGRDSPGHPLGKSRPEAVASDDLVLKCQPLVETLVAQLQGLDGGTLPDELGLPSSAGGTVSRDLLRQLVQRWGNIPSRQFSRQRTHSRVELLVGLRDIWNCLVGDRRGSVAREGRRGWIAANESPGGFSLMHFSGSCDPIRVGEVVAVRTADTCHICLVRWVQSENPEHLELGLEKIAPTAMPVTVAHADTPRGGPALLLPGMPALGQAAAILAPCGRMEAESDYRLDHRGLRWPVRSTHVLEQTLSIQMFRFRPADPRRSQPRLNGMETAALSGHAGTATVERNRPEDDNGWPTAAV